MTGFYMTEKEVKERVAAFRYIRDEYRNPIGVVVCDMKGRIGWSLYNTDCEDEWASTDKGLLIALSRAAKTLDIKEDLRQRILARARYGTVEGCRLMKARMDVQNMEKYTKGGIVRAALASKTIIGNGAEA